MEFALIDHSPRAAILAKSRVRVLVAIATLVVCGPPTSSWPEWTGFKQDYRASERRWSAAE
jgi:hypothetical protein